MSNAIGYYLLNKSEKNMPNIIIEKPYIENNGLKARLCSRIHCDKIDKVLYYEVDSCFAEYLDDSRVDAFLVGLLNSCMHEDYDIICNHPVSSTLLFQIKQYYIPIISKNFSNMHHINIEAAETNALIYNAGGVGTGNSGGVDSTYTMLKYKETGINCQNLTHVLFTNISTNDTDENRVRNLFSRDLTLKNEAAKSLGYVPINLFTNLFLFYKHPGIFNHFFAQQYCSAAFALAKLFKTYYFSSTWTVNEFSMNEKEIVSSARYDLFSLSTLTIPHLSFYSAGYEVTRTEKINYILHEGSFYSKRFLQVCSIEQSEGGTYTAEKLNCGYCNKCGRTIIRLYLDDLLDEYNDIFELKYFKRNKAKFIGRNLAADQKLFAKKLKAELKKKHKYPIFTSFYHLIFSLRYKLAKNKRLVSFYHKFKKEKNNV